MLNDTILRMQRYYVEESQESQTQREEGEGERWKLMTLGAKKNQVDADYLLIDQYCTLHSVQCTLYIVHCTVCNKGIRDSCSTADIFNHFLVVV